MDKDEKERGHSVEVFIIALHCFTVSAYGFFVLFLCFVSLVLE